MAGLSRKRRELDGSSVTMLQNIGDLFRGCREEAGMTQKEAAVVSTLTQAMISSIENGKSDIHVLTARRLALTYGYELEFALIKPEEEEEMKIEKWSKIGQPNIVMDVVLLTAANYKQVAVWVGATVVEEISPQYPDEKQPGLNVMVSGGNNARASLGMYVCKHVGAVYVSKAGVFEASYEPVAEAAAADAVVPGSAREALGFGTQIESREL